MLSVRCRVCGKELDGHPTRTKCCGCPNMTTIRGDNVSARDLTQVVMLTAGRKVQQDALTPGDLQWQEERRKRKIKKLDFEVR